MVEVRLKKCTKCGKELPLDQFHKYSRTKDGLRNSCKDCTNAMNRVYRESHKDELDNYWQVYHRDYYKKNKDRIYEKQQAYREGKRNFMDSLKTPCVKCGETRLYIIDFHHKVPSEKRFGLSTRFERAEQEVAEEAKKCVCLCRNCHGEFHHLYGINPSNPLEALEEYLYSKCD